MARKPESREARRQRAMKDQIKRKFGPLSPEMKDIIRFIPKGVSPARIALNYARMLRFRGFEPKGLMNINPVLFPNESACRRAVLLLRNNGMVAQSDDGRYGITARGELAIQLLQIREPSIVEPSGYDVY